MIRSYLKNSDFLLIDDQTDGLNDEEIEDIKNAIFTLIYVKNTTKTAILAFNNKKSLIETDKKIYLSFTKWFDINSINDFYDKDIFAFNYVNCSSRDFVLKRSGGYYLFDYEIAQNKKKKQTILKSQYKLNSKYDFNLEEGDQIFVKICSKDNIDLTNINDDKIDKLLSQSKAHIFDAVCGDKLI